MGLDLNDVSLFLATPAQAQASRSVNYPHWGRGLSLQEYLGRADTLDVHEHAADGLLMTWVLAPRNNPQTLDFLSACETFRRNALVQDAASSEPAQVFAYGIAAVFCPPQHRKHGYARHMMRLLHYVLASPESLPSFPPEWGAPPTTPPGVGNACFSVLWSDVGPSYYETCGPILNHLGWKLKDPIETIWMADPTVKHTGDVHWLSEQDCVELWKQDAHYIQERLRRNQPPPESSSVRCTFLPDNGLAAFQLRRARFFLPGLPGIPVPQKWGVVISGVGQPTYATWITDIRPLPVALLITRIRATAETLPILLSAIMVAAKENAAATVEVWNLEQHLVDKAQELNAITRERAEHLPALAWYGTGDVEDVEWLFNEKCVLLMNAASFYC